MCMSFRCYEQLRWLISTEEFQKKGFPLSISSNLVKSSMFCKIYFFLIVVHPCQPWVFIIVFLCIVAMNESIKQDINSYVPQSIKTQYLHFRSHAEYRCLIKCLKWLADDQSSSITKKSISIYYIKHMHMQPFSVEVDWKEIWHLKMDVSTMFYIVDTAFLFCGEELCQCHYIARFHHNSHNFHFVNFTRFGLMILKAIK